MSDIQLELNIDNKTPQELQFLLMQQQIDNLADSMGKVRRKLFSELGEIKKLYFDVQKENEELKAKLQELCYGKTEWIYGQNGCLFDVREYQQAIG